MNNDAERRVEELEAQLEEARAKHARTRLRLQELTAALQHRQQGEEVAVERAMRELRRAEERATTILESITDAFFAVDREWRVTYMNEQAERLLERRRDELLDKNLWEMFPDTVGSAFYREYQRTMEQETSATFEEYFPPLDGWFEIRTYASEDGLSVYFHDITDRKRAEMALREYGERQHFLAEAASMLAASLDYRDTLGRVARFAVPSLADWCVVDMLEGGRVERIEVAHADPAKEPLAQKIRRYPPDLENTDTPAARVLRTGRPELVPDINETWLESVTNGPEHIQLVKELGARSLIVVPIRARDHTLGSLALLAAGSRDRYDSDDLPVAEELGRRIGYAVDNARLFRQAERRAREEEALRRAASAVSAAFTVEEAIRQIAASALVATAAESAFVERLDAGRDELEIVAAAGERTLPLGRRFPYKDSLAAFVIERGEPEFVPYLAEARHGVSAELLKVCSDCSALTLPLVDAGEAIGVLILAHEPGKRPFDAEETERARIFADLASLAFRKVRLLEDSERRREELERVMESRERLMRGFTHDVKNPLGAAEGHLQLMEDGVLGEVAEKQRESLERIRRSIRRALELIDDLIQLARAEAGRLEIEWAPIDVRLVVEEIAGEYRAQAEAKGLEFRLEFSEALPIVKSDAGRIRQILGNLVSNAIKYTDEGEVEIRVERRENEQALPNGHGLALDVIDTGPGISEKQQRQLFREFQRLEPGTGRGAGLGLAISRRISELLGGTLTVESAPEKGSTFTLWLPLDDQREPASDES